MDSLQEMREAGRSHECERGTQECVRHSYSYTHSSMSLSLVAPLWHTHADARLPFLRARSVALGTVTGTGNKHL